MTTSFRSVSWALAIAAAGWFALRAAPPAPTGHVLILKNARILEGDVERIGDQYRVKYAVGETRVPADKVERLCANMEEAYRFLRDQANGDDPDEHLRLARWCHVHGLPEQAVAEAKQAVELRPSHAESRHFLSILERSRPATATATRAPEAETAAPAVEYNPESLGLFVTRVQPILMNACANCHATGRGGSTFRLTRAYTDELINHRTTQQNLAAVLAQVNRRQPETSALLSRAVTAHGEAGGPPLKGRQTPAFKMLEAWVQRAVIPEPREPPPPAAPVFGPDAAPPRSVPASPPPANAESTMEPGHPLLSTPPAPASPPSGTDLFDPMQFNGPAKPAADDAKPR